MVVRMTIDSKHVVESLQEAAEQVAGAEGEVSLDFSSVLRIDADAAGALERLVDLADQRSATVVLRGVNMEIYKVLTLLDLTRRFSFPR
jgi:anti-anti-sigma regulatory factor